MNIPWDKIIEVVIELVKMCLEQNQTDDKIKARMKNPTGVDWVRLWIKLRQAGCTIAEANASLRELRITTWGDEQYQDIIDQARNV